MGSITKLPSTRSAEKTATVLIVYPPVAGLTSFSVPGRAQRTWFRRVRQQLRRLRRWYGIAPNARKAYRARTPFVHEEGALPSPPHPHPFATAREEETAEFAHLFRSAPPHARRIVLVLLRSFASRARDHAPAL